MKFTQKSQVALESGAHLKDEEKSPEEKGDEGNVINRIVPEYHRFIIDFYGFYS